jgi:hypothetical protein
MVAKGAFGLEGKMQALCNSSPPDFHRCAMLMLVLISPPRSCSKEGGAGCECGMCPISRTFGWMGGE